MKLRLLAVVFLALALPAAAQRCMGGSGAQVVPLWDGYSLNFFAGYGEHAGKCHVTVTNEASQAIFETFAADVAVHEYTTKDINNDGKQDLVLHGHAGPREPWTYWIVSLGDKPGLARQIQTVFPLSFEDRDGDGKMEIWTREFSFGGIDGLSTDDSPFPQVAFRLVGNRLIYVSHLFPGEYSAEIAQARQRVTDDGVKRLKNWESGGTTIQKEKAGMKDQDDPKLDRLAYEAKAGVLTIVVANLYAGKGAEAWKELQEGWPYNDRDRIRQLMLRARQNGIMKQLNAPQPAASQAAAAAAGTQSNPQ